jgi:predicted GNAT superfamily acetyltransferase
MFKNTFKASKTLKQGWLNYKNVFYVIRTIKSKKSEIAAQNGPKVHSWSFGPARAANSMFRWVFTSSTFFGND